MYQKSGLPWTKYWDYILLDMVSMFLSLIAAYYVYIPTDFNLTGSPEYLLLLFGMPVLDFLVIVLGSTMNEVQKRGLFAEFCATVKNTAMVFAIEALIFFVVKMGGFYSRKNFLYSCSIYFVVSFATRCLYKWYYVRHVVPNSGSSLLIVAAKKDLPGLEKQIREGQYSTYRLAGVILADGDQGDTALKVVSAFAQADSWIRKNWVDEVLFLLPPEAETLELAQAVASMGITVHLNLGFLSSLLGGTKTVEVLGEYDVLTAFRNRIGFGAAAVKRLTDIVGGLVGCLFTAILTLFIGPAIYIASPGPIFYTQERIGRNGKVFQMYKFRSMVPNADEVKKQYLKENRVSGGYMFKLDWDPRIIGNKILPDGTKKTGIGEFIRKTSLDEFPQFLNVLKGDMSLVGTRPPTKDEWAIYEDHHRARMAMRPGITGMWQVSGRSNITDFEEIVRLDTKYIDQWSLGLDFKILVKTVLVVLKHEGSM
ncbi:MAG: sugar transferase [Candidatus Faecousia sp.]|nr:sugar transferase [Candidatus Faecousia sp.]